MRGRTLQVDFCFLQSMLGSGLLINICLIQEDTAGVFLNVIDAIADIKMVSLKLTAFASMLVQNCVYCTGDQHETAGQVNFSQFY